MENPKMNNEAWVNARLASLEPEAAWQPDAARAFQRFERRRRNFAIRWRGAAGLLAAAVVTLVVLNATAPRACAKPRGCEQAQPSAPAQTAPPQRIAPSVFKVQGSPKASVTIEIYSDYQCPSCALFFKTVMPLLDAQYVKTGKIRIQHRDLPFHTYSHLAARYANAAGAIGKYDATVDALFRSQQSWEADGNLPAALSFVLTPDEMKNVRQAVDSDKHLDDTLTEDLDMALKDKVHSTPTLVIVSKSGRQALSQYPAFETLRPYLDSLLAQ
jgi:protein-disulfide isomerase